MTPERIAELRAIIAAASLMDEEVNMGIGKAVTQKEFYQSAKLAFPQALDTIEAQQRRIEELEADLIDANKAIDMTWLKGCPDKVRGSEWFIAIANGHRVVLKALPEEVSYDYKTADETYYLARCISAWMQFPDSEFKKQEEIAALQPKEPK